ncbi:endonuclease V [Streptomyces sp. NPDC051940]|uniref:endonuclease V n=1 Tax=Streptomyces sp. NPDC051940 TaxID=3155675 RepID=UPI003436AE2D
METEGTAGWPTTEAEALAVQLTVRERADLTDPGPGPGDARLIAGVDVAYDEGSDRLAAAVVLLDAATLDIVESATAAGVARFPYVPGLLAFRELPPVLDALAGLSRTPDLIVCDGYGLAHPRRAGLAVHLGVRTGLPCFGVAKTPFLYGHPELGPLRGDSAPLLDGEEVVGRALRTRPGVRPVYVSTGHRISLDHACAHTLALTANGYRQPETTRRADALCRAALRDAVAG